MMGNCKVVRTHQASFRQQESDLFGEAALVRVVVQRQVRHGNKPLGENDRTSDGGWVGGGVCVF